SAFSRSAEAGSSLRSSTPVGFVSSPRKQSPATRACSKPKVVVDFPVLGLDANNVFTPPATQPYHNQSTVDEVSASDCASGAKGSPLAVSCRMELSFSEADSLGPLKAFFEGW